MEPMHGENMQKGWQNCRKDMGISSGDQGGDDIACTKQEIRRECLHARLMTVTRVFECLAILVEII